MNLTSKRLLQFFAGCVGVCAFTVSADTTYYVKDTFDEASVISYEGSGSTPVVAATNGMDIAHYKSTLNAGDSTFFTNSWFAATGDASALTNVAVSFSGNRPLTDPIGSLVLNLETEGQTLTRALATSQDFGVSDVYIDTLIKFTPSEDTPTIADDVKAAVFVNVNSNLVVYHGGVALVSTDVGQYIDPSQWYRLTILMSKLGELGNGGETVFKVYINGIAVTSADGFDDNLDPNGPWFKVANGATAFSAVAFQGTGMIDELVVADAANALVPPTGIMLTLSFDETHLAVKVNGSPVSSGTQVATGTTLVMNTVDWWQINNITGDGISFTNHVGFIGIDNLVTNSVTDVGADGAGRTATIELGLYQGVWPTGISGTFTQYSLNTVATWADANGVSLLAALMDSTNYEDDYLMNTPAGTNAKPTITSIVVEGGVATITVSSTDTEAVDLTNLNGTLKVYTADSLAGTFTEAGSYSLDSETATIATFTINMGTAKFIKAVVE